MKKGIIVLALLILSISTKAQFFHSVEFNSGCSINSIITEYNSFNGNAPVSKKGENFIGLSTALNLTYLSHKYWNLNSQLGYMESGNKTISTGYNFNTHENWVSYDIFYFNFISFNTVLEIKYPIKNITPSIKFGPRIDYTYLDISPYDILNKFNYGFALGAGLNYSFKGHFNLHADYIYNWFAKDLISASDNSLGTSHTVSNPGMFISKNMTIMIGFGYAFGNEAK